MNVKEFILDTMLKVKIEQFVKQMEVTGLK